MSYTVGRDFTQLLDRPDFPPSSQVAMNKNTTLCCPSNMLDERTFFPVPFFLYGREAVPEFIQYILKSQTAPVLLPARIGSRRVIQFGLPLLQEAIVRSSNPFDFVKGSVYCTKTPWELQQLKTLASGFRKVTYVSLHMWNGLHVTGKAIVFGGFFAQNAQMARETVLSLSLEQQGTLPTTPPPSAEYMAKMYGRVWPWLAQVENCEPVPQQEGLEEDERREGNWRNPICL